MKTKALLSLPISKKFLWAQRNWLGVLFIAGSGLVNSAQGDTLTWSGGNSTDFNAAANYSPILPTPANHDLYFNSPTSGSLRMTANLNIASMHIQAGSDGFVLGRGSNRSLAILGDGFVIDSNVHAIIHADAAVHSAQPEYTLKMQVETGGSLTMTGAITLATAKLVKNGAGTLIIEKGTGALRKLTSGQGSIFFNEGTVELGAEARIGWSYGPGDMDPAKVFPEMLLVALGTATQSATLTGAGKLEGQLITHGVTQSAIRPDGELSVHTLNAESGASLAYNLSSSNLIKGAGVFTSSLEEGGLAFNFEGGAANVTYTLLDFESITGMEVSDFSIVSNGYELDETFGAGGWEIDAENGTLKVRFAAIPEPNTTACLIAASLALVGTARFFSASQTKTSVQRKE